MVKPKLVIAISSRALFNLDDSHAVFKEQGVEAYTDYQIKREQEPLKPGVAFHLAQKLLKLNIHDPTNPLVEVILLSRNTADTGLRIFNSIQHYQLPITRAVFSGGESPNPYFLPLEGHLFLSANGQDVKEALAAGVAAAHILSGEAKAPPPGDTIRIAFDGDAVIFSDESEKICQKDGVAAFSQREAKLAGSPLPGGPFKSFLAALHTLQVLGAPIRTALVTARAVPAHERVIKTLRLWNIRIDEAFFLGGLDKGEFLKAFQADIFFDDQWTNCESARQYVATGHVGT